MVNKNIFTLILASLVFILIWFITNFDAPVVVKVLASVLLLIGSGMMLGKIWNQETYYGIILFKSQKMINEIKAFGKRFESFFKLFADITLVWGLGLFGGYILYKHTSLKRTLIVTFIGLILIISTTLIIAPTVFNLSSYVIKGIDYTTAYKQTQQQTPFLVAQASQIMLLLGGYMLTFTVMLIYYGIMMLSNTAMVLMNGAIPLEPVSTVIIPGISIPLIEGIVALIILLFIHETSHGFLASVANVRLTSVGVALFGIIPMGAFVDPDDKQLAKKTTIEKIRVYIAGSGANFTAMLLFFIVFLMIQPYILSQSEYDYVYYGELENYSGQEIAFIDNTPISEIDFKTFEYSSGDKFNITTNKGDKFTAIVDENDNLGIIKRMSITNPLARFVFNLIALLVCLNFFVAAFNLLPVSILDGYQILLQVLGDKRTRYISYVLIIALIAQFIPWLWK